MEYFKAEPTHHRTLKWEHLRSFEVSSGWDCYWLRIWPLRQNSRFDKAPVLRGRQTFLSAVHFEFLKWWRISKPLEANQALRSPSMSAFWTWIHRTPKTKGQCRTALFRPIFSSSQNLPTAKSSANFETAADKSTSHKVTKLNNAFHSLCWSCQEANYSSGFSSNAWLNVRDL